MRVLVVDDSAFMRKVVGDMIKAIGHDVIGTAKNGKEAVELTMSLKPDVLTLDIEMPIMNGLDALKRIMETCPTPVVMLSTLTEAGAAETIEALELGAVDFMTKPTSIFRVSTPENIQELKFKLEAAAASRLRRPRPVTSKPTIRTNVASTVFSRRAAAQRGGAQKLVAIGTSTGGPVALQEVVSRLPADLNAPVVIVQHMPANFTHSLANRLDSVSALDVKEAEHDEIMRKGAVYIAPGDKHLKIVRHHSGFMIKLSDSDRVNGHRPSVDVMMNSISELSDLSVIGVIMTGMGNDGTAGLISLKKKGAFVISQDESSSVVFGMPGSAVRAGVVDVVVDVRRIADEISKAVEG